MLNDTLYKSLLSLLVAAVISCSGSSGSRGAGVKERGEPAAAAAATQTDSRPSKRLIEILSPAENSSHSCSAKINLSIAPAAGNPVVDSVQVWVDGRHATTLSAIPAFADVGGRGYPGKVAVRAVAYSRESKPHTVTLFVNLLSDISPVIYRFKVVKSYPHDRRAYTQGLLYDGGYLYESTGQEGASSLRKVELESGRVVSQVNLDPSLFGEGLALLGGHLYQLTWTSKVGFVYEKESLRQLKRIYYQTQGWGLASIGDSLVMSDGSNMLWFLDPDFNVLSSVEVWDNKGMVDNLNELEMIRGELWANIWQTDRIVRIDPVTGKVLGYLLLNNLLPRSERSRETDVLNGIAWDEDDDRIFVTGKYWPRLYHISVTPA